MLKPPKIHFVGDSQACAKWLPFAQKKMEYLMTVFQGQYFHKKFAVPGATIWLDNDAYVRRILIQAGRALYEFMTADNIDRTSWPIPRDVRFTRVRSVARSRNYAGERFTEDNDPFNGGNPFLLNTGIDIVASNLGGFDQYADDWFSANGSRMTFCRVNWGRYMDEFYHLNARFPDATQYPLPKGGGIAMQLTAGGKPNHLGVAISSGDSVGVSSGNHGSTACVAGGFEILASAVGYDHLFAVHHPGSGQTIEVQPEGGVPSWIEGRVHATWAFSPDGRKAVSLQYWSDVEGKLDTDSRSLSAPPHWMTGLSEVIFNPYLDTNGVLQCDCTLGQQIEGKADLFLLAADYDMKDSSVLRVFRCRAYHDSPDSAFNDRVCLLIIGEWATLADNEILPPYRRDLLFHAPAIRDDGVLPTRSTVEDESEGNTNPLYTRHGYGLVDTQVGAMDLRRNAWCYQRHMIAPEASQHAGEHYPRRFYRYEWGIDGEQRDNHWEQGFVLEAAKIAMERDWSEMYPGYTEWTTASPYWLPDLLYSYWEGSDGSYFNAPLSRSCLFDRVWSLKPNLMGGFYFIGAGFRVHPGGHFALFCPPIWFSTEQAFYVQEQRYGGVPLGSTPDPNYVFSAPAEMIVDHIEYASGATTSHLQRFNADRVPPDQFVIDDKEVVALAPYGVWII